MTRKKYIKNMQALIIRIYNDPDVAVAPGSLGRTLRHFRNTAKLAALNYGSYDAAWNNPVLKQLRYKYDL